MKYKLKEYDIWECGQRVDAQGNPHQEDSIYPLYGQGKDTDRLFILCDGMGGHAAGEVASSTVCEALSESILAQQPDTEGEFTDEMLKRAITDAYEALDARDTDIQGKKMGTTMTLLKLHDHGATIAHMGDSRVYHIRPGKDAKSTHILFCTRDHSLVNDLVRAGEMTEEEARTSSKKNIITRAMQPNTEYRHKPEIYHTVDIKPGDYFYLCSDGMLEQMSDENLRFNFSALTGGNENKVQVLTQATGMNRDNHSAIIVQVTDVIDPLPVPSPAAPIIAPVEGITNTSGTSRSGNGKWIAVAVVALLILGALIWYTFFFNQQSQPQPAPLPKPEMEQEVIDINSQEVIDNNRQQTADRKQQTGNKRQETGNKKPEKTTPSLDNMSTTLQNAGGGSTAKPESKPETKPETKPAPKPEAKPEAKPAPEPKPESTPEP